jgi:hypothetical protein
MSDSTTNPRKPQVQLIQGRGPAFERLLGNVRAARRISIRLLSRLSPAQRSILQVGFEAKFAELLLPR